MTRKRRQEGQQAKKNRVYSEVKAELKVEQEYKPYIPFYPTPQPKTVNHSKYHNLCKDPNKRIVLCDGWAGCGKTIVMAYYAAKALKNEKIDGIVISRSLEGVGQYPGAYKGDPMEKNAPKLKALMNYISAFTGIDLATLIGTHRLEVQGLYDIQGQDFTRKWLLVTECQTLTPFQMYQVVTRGAEKLILEGDTCPAQLTNTKVSSGHDGLSFLMKTIGDLPFVGRVTMHDENDIVRQDYLKQVITRMMPALAQYK